MLEVIQYLAFLVPLLPFFAALGIGVSFLMGWNRGEAGERMTVRMALGAMTLSTLILLILTVHYAFNGVPTQVDGGLWLSSGLLQVRLVLLLDGLSLSVATALSMILLLVVRFSVTYLHREAAFQRFFMVLMLLCFAMEVIWLAGNAVLTFIGWEVAGVSSYLLIAYNWYRPTATLNAQRAFITNRIGDAGFILALVASLAFLQTLDWELMPAQAQTTTISSLQLAIVTTGLTFAACAKSAQLPFSSWITHALEGPTPSSAVFYGSVMVHAGVYLLLRAAPLLSMTPALSYFLGFIGLLTLLYAWLAAQAQTDVKSSLIFATLMQVALMLIEIALGWYTLATVHLILHAWWRAYQFLHAPAFMQLTHYPAPATATWLRTRKRLFNAALQRFWLDSISDTFLVKPTQALARDAQVLEDHVIDRLTGTPFAHQPLVARDQTLPAKAGLPGQALYKLSELALKMEAYLTIHVGNSTMLRALIQVERYLEIVDDLLRKPYYLIVLIMVTLVIVL